LTGLTDLKLLAPRPGPLTGAGLAQLASTLAAPPGSSGGAASGAASRGDVAAGGGGSCSASAQRHVPPLRRLHVEVYGSPDEASRCAMGGATPKPCMFQGFTAIFEGLFAVSRALVAPVSTAAPQPLTPGLQALSRLPHLNRLWLDGPLGRLGGADVAALAALPALRVGVRFVSYRKRKMLGCTCMWASWRTSAALLATSRVRSGGVKRK
jgi:hypothetical protein